MSQTMTVTKTPQKVQAQQLQTPSRDIDALISARKAQLDSAKQRNDQLYSTLHVRAQARSTTKAPQPPSSALSPVPLARHLAQSERTSPPQGSRENEAPSPPSFTAKPGTPVLRSQSPGVSAAPESQATTSPWKSHLRSLKAAREGVASAADVRRQEVAQEAADRDNDQLMEGVASQLDALRAAHAGAVDALRSEARAGDAALSARLAAAAAEAFASVEDRLSSFEALRGPLSVEVAAKLAGLGKQVEDARDAMDEAVMGAQSAVTVAAERTAALAAEVADHAALCEGAVANQARLEAQLAETEERLGGKVVGHMDDAFEGLEASFLSLFDANSAAVAVRADATAALVGAVRAAGEADRGRILALEEASSARQAYLEAFSADQRSGLNEVRRAKAQMEADVKLATAALVCPPPSQRQRVFLALGVWTALLLLAFAFLMNGVEREGLRTAY